MIYEVVKIEDEIAVLKNTSVEDTINIQVQSEISVGDIVFLEMEDM